jgi:hypothetical protein
MNASPTARPEDFEFRVPWHETDAALHDELYREVSPQHALYGRAARAVARRQDNDDVLFELLDNDAPAAFAVVHLTWSGKPDWHPLFPSTELYSTFPDWIARCMTPEADDWQLSEQSSESSEP